MMVAMYRSVMIKPASSACNLHCSYCFYLDEVANRQARAVRVMSEETARQTISKFLEASDGVCFAFQGGEPTLAGTGFFRKFFSFVEQENRSHKTVTYALQSNGYALPDGLIPLLKEHDVLVGISLDGPRQLQDLHRRSPSGGPSFSNVRDTVRALENAGVAVNLLSVVTNESAANADKLMRFYMDQGKRYLQFIPCLSPLREGEEHNPFLSPENYLIFLEQVWRYWYPRLGTPGAISVRLFDNWLAIAMGGHPEECGAIGICSVEYVVEADGSVYPCDFYCLDDYCLGTIVTQSVKELDARRENIKFIPSSLTTAKECGGCPYLRYCGGGCRRYRTRAGRFVYCDVYRTFLNRHMTELQRSAAFFLQSTR